MANLAVQPGGAVRLVDGRLYLAGPMSGLPHLNWPTFSRAAAALRIAGYDVRSPHEVLHEGLPGNQIELPWEAYVRNSLRALLDCDAVALLPGWATSRGARLEVQTALGLDMPLFLWDGWQLVDINTPGPGGDATGVR